MANTIKQAHAYTFRHFLEIFHLSDRKIQPPKYAMNAAMGTFSAVKRKVEKSAISKTNNAADHSKFGRYNTKVLHAIGNTHAIATKSNKTPNTALISGTNKILSSNDQPEI